MNKDIKNNWRNILVSEKITVLAAIKHIDTHALRVLLVVDEQERLLGVITDGDIRRYLLKQSTLEETINNIMNKNPATATLSESKEQLMMRMHSLSIFHLPIVDNNKRVIGLETLESLFAKKTRENWVVIMAGGVGKRLHPLTLECPKPLVKVGEKPIAEILLENFIKCGFRNFYFSINYKAEMMREYFGNGEKWGVQIRYIEEDSALGTAGSLSLLPTIPDKPFFVVNADILTNIDLGYILDFHQEYNRNAYATLCVRQYQNTIPFGLVHIDEVDHKLLDIEEKPTKVFFVNAGIYVLNPKVLTYLNFNTYLDMPHFLLNLVKNGMHVTTFPIREYWLDVGHHDNLIQATIDYSQVFS